MMCYYSLKSFKPPAAASKDEHTNESIVTINYRIFIIHKGSIQKKYCFYFWYYMYILMLILFNFYSSTFIENFIWFYCKSKSTCEYFFISGQAACWAAGHVLYFLFSAFLSFQQQTPVLLFCRVLFLKVVCAPALTQVHPRERCR